MLATRPRPSTSFRAIRMPNTYPQLNPARPRKMTALGDNLRRIDEIEAAGEGAEQTDHRVCRQVERERQRQSAHFVECHDRLQNTAATAATEPWRSRRTQPRDPRSQEPHSRSITKSFVFSGFRFAAKR